MQAVSKKFYSVFVPTVLSNMPNEQHSRGTMAINRRVDKHFFITGGQRELKSVQIAQDGKSLVWNAQVVTKVDPDD